MRSRLGCLVLAASMSACGSDGGGAKLLPELPDDFEDSDASALSDAGSAGDASKPTVRRDATVSTSEDGGLTDDNACAATAIAAQQVVVTVEVPVTTVVETPAPVALYVMLDRSWSMDGYQNAPVSWPGAVSAIKSFVSDDSSKGMDIALQYFPTSGGACGGGGYSTPAVAMGALPGRATAIASSLDNTTARGLNTPTEGALRGATAYCASFQAAHPDEKCVAVLVTDGEPNGCNEKASDLAAIAASAWQTSQVRTFTVGLQGADFTLLDQIAMAGGAVDCDGTSSRFSCDVSAGADKLSDALATIRDSVKTVTTHTETTTKTETRPLDCQWQMPMPGADQTLDKDRVNVTLSGQETLPLGRVQGADKCQDGAWYYDNNDAPTQIQACPTTCDAIKAGTYTDVKILLGCETKYLTVI